MLEPECHSPRPFIHKQVKSAPQVEYLDYRTVPFTNDPVQRFEFGNSSPYPVVSRTSLTDIPKLEHRWAPSNELDLSMLDSALTSRTMQQTHLAGQTYNSPPVYCNTKHNPLAEINSNVLAATEKPFSTPPNILRKNEDFFIQRDKLNGYTKLSSELGKLHLEKENNPLLKKSQIMMTGQANLPLKNVDSLSSSNSSNEMDNSICRCHHCIKVYNTQHIERSRVEIVKNQNINRNSYNVCHCITMLPQNHAHCVCNIPQMRPVAPNCNCNIKVTPSPQNAVDKKTWAIQKYEQNNNTECLDVEKQTNITMDKQEPTVADLFKIIKMQNEQLQLLQDKVDKFISSNTNNGNRINPPAQNYITEQVALQSGSTEQKISIGVMTSFEVVRTSTIINKEFVKQNEAQIQCNRSQISIKEVVSKQPDNLNFLDGLSPVSKQVDMHQPNKSNPIVGNGDAKKNDYTEDKTLNEMSLFNVQVDNVITPNISPEQSLYLDIRDYSDSDASSDDQSNVGWTYYNKVMTHVNGMLQESDMPSSASALYRNVKQKCMQMQIDKSNVSVAKRVTFGDSPQGMQRPQVQHIANPSTDTSLKMKELAAKYLNQGTTPTTPSPRPTMPVDMSLATRNYMEKHRILQGTNMQPGHQMMDIPKFLDITALKQQPKFL
ncbi:jg12714 [Pararge aegeria aegeria]|uniref:Jg12714 protein n=1 Tax=Pararge aegeria aegeria TaxID=348720 RepID=A0A8S4S1N4_9NEOP|nr:jg12714 [Pararge aegeria aegeria]